MPTGSPERRRSARHPPTPIQAFISIVLTNEASRDKVITDDTEALVEESRAFQAT